MRKLEEIFKVIKETAKMAGGAPGVYKMIGDGGVVIYVGKAKNLRNRLLSYANFDGLSNRIKMMIAHIHDIEITVVNSEVEALLLENNLIKKLKPFYNILLKDDKTFPYIVFGSSIDFPRIFKYRTLKPKGDGFYGPYPSVVALDETIKIIQKIFLLRNCTDNYFTKRKRPCLQYFIKRCSAPCVGKISKCEYLKNVEMAKNLLEGKDESVRKKLVGQMKDFATSKDFEQAALIRDRLKALSEIQSKQYVQIDNVNSIDFIAIAMDDESAVVGITFFRVGKNVGTESFTLGNISGADDSDIIESFITQFYNDVSPPSRIIVDCDLANSQPITELFEIRNVDTKMIYAKHGTYKRILDTCRLNVKMKLKKNGESQYGKQILELNNMLKIDKIDRIETYDNSHIQGTNACGVMVVFEKGAIQKNKFRKFNITEKIANGGDDISMMKFSLEKRFKSQHIPEIPDVIVIDGGKTQVAAVKEIVEKFELSGKVKVIGIAKQNNRRIGDEKIVFENGEERTFERSSKLLAFLIMLRNEAHKSAIRFHRQKRQKILSRSVIDEIPFIGKIRKRLLLEHFGSVDFIKKASLEDLKMVKGIDNKTAESIFEFLRERDE
ncbi:MAG: excinuclease ABC subunit UvrC [Holosporales bacterium]|jgi:excinuclease ABC subunit C|nr:excinuclease ABC subunit UvrC [Holosporales bacterium]